VKKLQILALLIGVSFTCAAQQYTSFKKFPNDNPLSYKSVQTITQDSDGFIWLGSQEGLHRFDGYQFLSFHHDANNPKSLSSDVISRVLVDHSAQLWVATRGGGVNIYQEVSQSFRRIDSKNSELKLTNDNVNALIEDSHHNIWVGTDNGLNIIFRDGESWSIKQIYNSPDNTKSLTNNSVEAIIQTANGNIWVGTNGGGISVFDVNGRFVKQINLEQKSNSSSLGKLITALFQDHQGNIWVGTSENGLIKYNPDSRALVHYRDNGDSISSNTIEEIYQDSHQKIWIATDKGALVYDYNIDRFQRINHSISNPASLTNDFVLSFFEDNNQMMWIGTFSGVNRWDPNMTTFNQFNNSRFPEISSSLVMDFTLLNSNQLMFSTYTKGVYQLTLDTGEVEAFELNYLIKGLRAMALLIDGAKLWLGTRASGLIEIDLQQGKIKKHQYEENNANSLSANSVTDIIKDSHGNIWASTFNNGLNKLNSDGTFTRYEVTSPVSNKGPSIKHILQILEDNRGYLWLATYGGGINRFDPVTEEFIHIKHSDNNNASLSSDLAWILEQDKENNLWVGTQAAGLNLLTNRNMLDSNFVFQRFNVKSGMRDQSVYSLSEDAASNIWFSSNKGISYYSPKLNSFKHFDTRHGLIDLEYNHGAIFKAPDNTLYFGSAKGVTSVNPSNILNDHPAPNVRLTNILKLNEPMTFKQRLSALSSISFDYTDQLISFEYVGLNYAAPESTRYKYRLKGFDEEWIDAGKSRRATYTNLPSGSYQLEIIAGNNDNVWSDPYLLTINMTPAPWNTWWAYLLYAVLIALLLLAYSRFLNRKLLIEQQQKSYLKQQIQEKTQEFQLKNIELEQANQQLEDAATVDKVTGVKSRRYLDIYIEQASQLLSQIHENILPVQRSLLPRLYLVMIKLNNIEQITNSQLVNLTDLLLYSRNDDDLVIRWADDSFVIIGYEKDDNARELVARLANRFEQALGQNVKSGMAYSFYPFNFEQPMALSWDQVSVITEHALSVAEKNNINWLGFYSPKIQPFNYLDVIQQQNLEELTKLVKLKKG